MFDRSFPNEKWVNSFHDRISTDRGLPPALQCLVEHTQSDVIHVLDVGAGPASRLGTVSAGRRVEVSAIDPLANEYRKLFEEFGLTPRIAPIEGQVERLEELFPAEHFDLVYCRNALDHSHDPLAGVHQMVRVCKVGGFCWLRHASNEGEAQGYRGLHQWNLSARGSDMIICGKPGTPETSLRDALAGMATVEADTSASGWFTATIHKKRQARMG